MQKNMSSKTIKDLFQLAVENIFCNTPKEISMFHFIYYCKSGVNFENLCNTENGAQQDRVAGGT